LPLFRQLRRGKPRLYRVIVKNLMGDTILRELVYGKGAHVDPVACVEDVSAELAARTMAGYPHSIWQIVEHVNYWMDYDCEMCIRDSCTYDCTDSCYHCGQQYAAELERAIQTVQSNVCLLYTSRCV